MSEQSKQEYSLPSLILILCAVAMTGLVFWREFLRPVGPTEPQVEDVVLGSNWLRMADSGRRIGPLNAKVTLVEYGDFECPACRRFTQTALKAARAAYPTDFAVVFRHWPLEYHRFAYPAARASECAAEQGRFTQMHDLLYSKQDSLGLKTFESFASDAGVEDLSSFVVCASDTSTSIAIESSRAAASKLGARGTPAIVLNGRLLATPPDSARLMRLISEALER